MQYGRANEVPAARFLIAGLAGAAVGAAVAVAGNVPVGSSTIAPPTPSTTDETPSIETLVNRALGLRRSDLIRLEGAFEPGAPVRTVLAVDGRLRTLEGRLHSVRSGAYRVYRDDATDGLREVEPGPVNTLRGSLLEEPGSVFRGGVLSGGLYGAIRLADGSLRWIEPIARPLGRAGDAALAGLHVVYAPEDVLPVEGICGTTANLVVAGRQLADAGPSGVGNPVQGGAYRCEIACDADFEYWLRWQGQTEARINLVLATMDEQYLRDVNIRHEIVAVVIRTAPVYTTTDPEGLLNQFRDRWIANHTNIPRDIAHLFTGKEIDYNVIGIAWIAAVCESVFNGFAYGVAQSDFNGNFGCATDLSAHELGHNWDARHCDCSSFTMNPFITCSNRFHPTLTIPTISSYRNGAGCLDRDEDPPTNDSCSEPRVVFAGDFPYSTSGATTDGPALPEACDEGQGIPFQNDIWFEYIALCDGIATADLCDSDFDTRIGVYEVGSCPGELIACNDDLCGSGGTRSRVSWVSTRLEHYIIRVGGRTQTGSGTLSISCTDGVPCPADLDRNGVVEFADIIVLLTAWGPCGGCPEDLDSSGTVDFGDIIVLLSAWGPCE